MIKYWTISKYFRSLDFDVSLIVRQCLQYFSRCPMVVEGIIQQKIPGFFKNPGI